jgi:hypothetical protein
MVGVARAVMFVSMAARNRATVSATARGLLLALKLGESVTITSMSENRRRHNWFLRRILPVVGQSELLTRVSSMSTAAYATECGL